MESRRAGTTMRIRRRPSTASRRFGYAVSAIVNLALWYAVTTWPGWEVVPFLTAETRLVLPVLIASFILGATVNLAWLIGDPPWFKAFGNLLTAVVGVAVGVRFWQVFPFDFAPSTIPWPLLVRMLLGLGIAGAVIGALASLIAFVVALVARDGG